MNRREIVRVRTVMHESVLMVDGRTTVGDAIRSMKEGHSTSIIVDKRHDDDEYGIVLLSDVAKKVIAADKSVNRVNVYEIMSKPVISVHPEMDIRYCARLFEQFGLSVAPVVEGGRVIGTVSYDGIVLDGLVHLE